MAGPSATAACAPRVAVIVPAYGVAHLLPEALTSVRAQTLTDWECIVVDDGAPDDVTGAVAPFLDDPRIRFLATQNHGVSAARNRAVAMAHAPYVALLDGDDLFRADYLASMVACLDADPAIRLVTCNARIFGAVRRERFCVERPQQTTGSLSDILDRSFNVYIGSTFRRADFDRIGGFDERMTHAEDFDLWVRLMLLGGQAHYIDRILAEYRVRPQSASASGEAMRRGTLRVYEKALAQLSDRPEAALAVEMAERYRAALALDAAIARVIESGTADAVAALRAIPDRPAGLSWSLALQLWRILPGLAAPMLRWRNQAHRRGRAAHDLPALGPDATGEQATARRT